MCALQWSAHDKELVSSHGYSHNQLILWKYPSMVKVAELTGHTARVLHMLRTRTRAIRACVRFRLPPSARARAHGRPHPHAGTDKKSAPQRKKLTPGLRHQTVIRECARGTPKCA